MLACVGKTRLHMRNLRYVMLVEIFTNLTDSKVDRTAAYDNKNSPRERWRRAVFLVGRLQDGNRILRASGIHADAEEKHLETQHWLELVDE